MFYPRDARVVGGRMAPELVAMAFTSAILLGAAIHGRPYIIPAATAVVRYMFYPVTAPTAYILSACRAFPSERQLAAASDGACVLATSEFGCLIAILCCKKLILQHPLRTLAVSMVVDSVAAVVVWVVNHKHMKSDWETWCCCFVFMAFGWVVGVGSNWLRIERFYEYHWKERVQNRRLRLMTMTEAVAASEEQQQ